jgi:hypothetical protein
MDDRIDRPSGSGWPPWVNLVAGVWLIISAFAWPHALVAQTNAWVVGLLIALVSLSAMFAPAMRYVDTMLAIWLFFSAIAFTTNNSVTPWNDLLAAVVVFLVSLVPTTAMTTPSGDRLVHA